MHQEKKPSYFRGNWNKAGAMDAAVPFLLHAQGDAAFTSLLSQQSTSGTSDRENVPKKGKISCKVGFKTDFHYEFQQKLVIKSGCTS